MSKEKRDDHILRYRNLHRSLDELITDFITHTGKRPSDTTILELIKWSYYQTVNPTE